MKNPGRNQNKEPLKRIDRKYVWEEVCSILNFEKGLFYTVRELLIRPGKTVREFIQKDRNRLVKPIIFIIICSFFYSVVQKIFNFEDGYVGYSFEKESAINSIFDWISMNYGYSNILMAFFIALWIKIFFRKYNYNIYETLVLLCFLMGIEMLLFAFFGIADSLTEFRIINKGYLIGVIYILWAIVQFFDNKKFMNFLKAMVSYLLGTLTFMIVIFIVGTIIDFLL